MPEFSAALFDFDGVVVDSTPMHLAGWDQAYAAMFKQSLGEDMLNGLVGRSTAAIGSILSEHSGYPAAKAELIRRKAVYVLENLETIPLIPGSHWFLRKLGEAGIPFGVVSNAPRAFIGAALEKHGIPCPFYLGLEDYYRPKPDPEPYMKGAKAIGLSFSQHPSVAVFEDSTHGIESAIAAHMTALGICSQHPAAKLLAAGAKRCFAHFEDDSEALLESFGIR